jgi:hypothetical protein
MAIRLEFINLIVPIRVIEQKVEGGWEQFSRDYGLEGESTVSGCCWRDNKLFRDGAMSPMDMHFMVEGWKSQGLRGPEVVDGQLQWQDFCVVGGIDPHIPCPWLKINERNWTAYYRRPPVQRRSTDTLPNELTRKA